MIIVNVSQADREHSMIGCEVIYCCGGGQMAQVAPSHP